MNSYARVKIQNPRSKIQKSSKYQAPTGGSQKRGAIAYPSAWTDDDLFLKEGKERHAFDLEERTTIFGEKIVRFSKKIPRDPTNNRLIDQIVGAGTSIGANYCEANESVSKKDLRFTVGRCVKEAKETKFFLRMIAASEPQLASDARELYREARELHLIFASMFRNAS